MVQASKISVASKFKVYEPCSKWAIVLKRGIGSNATIDLIILTPVTVPIRNLGFGPGIPRDSQ